MREGCPARPGAQGDSPEPPRLARRRAWDPRPGERRRQGEGPRRQRWPRAPLEPRGPSQGALARGSRHPGDRRPWPDPLLTWDLRGLGSVLLRRRPRRPSLTPSIHSGRLMTRPAQRDRRRGGLRRGRRDEGPTSPQQGPAQPIERRRTVLPGSEQFSCSVQRTILQKVHIMK